MTDRHDPDQPTPAEPAVDVPPFEMPTAGRPAAPMGGAGDPDEPTVVSGPGEETRPIARPPAQKDRLTALPPAQKDRPTALPPAEKDRSDEKKWPVLRGADEDETRLLRAPSRETEDDKTQLLRPPPRAELGSTADDEPTVERERPADEDRPDERLRAVAEQWLSARERDNAEPEAGERPATSDADETASSTDRVSSVRGVDDPGAVGSGDVPVQDRAGDDAAVTDAESSTADVPKPARRKLTSAGTLIWVLLALLGYTLVVQLRSNNDDQGLATARQEDLVSILSDLESRDSRLQSEIASLQDSQRQLTSGVSSRQAALAEAEKRADELGLLAGTLPGKGPGLKIVIDKVKASAILNAVEELRGAGGEVMELAGADGTAVRIVASSYFVDAAGGGIDADGTRLDGPWTLWVIGSPQTMQTALQIPGGVVASVNGAGGSVTMQAQTMVEVTAVRKATNLQYARPVS